MKSRLIGFGAVVGGVIAVALLAWLTIPARSSSVTEPVTGSTALVTSAEFACPPAPARSPAEQLALASVPGPHASGGTLTLNAIGSRTIHRIAEQATRIAMLVNPPAAADATGLRASGNIAQGLTAEMANSRGISVGRCAQPGSDLWFAGTGEAAGASGIELYLMNSDQLPATVSVMLMTDSGVVQGEPYEGITVPPGQTVTENLTTALRNSGVVAIDVYASAGRVAASVWESGSGNSGTWLPQTAEPAGTQVITGLSASGSAARLFIAVPGNQNAAVKVVALTPQGRFLPFGATPLSAPSNAVSEFPLDSLGAGAAGIELISNVPVTAAVAVPGTGLGSVAPAGAPVAQQAVVAGNPVKGYSVTVVLSAPVTAARVNLSALTGPATQVTVPAEHSVAVTVHAPPGAARTFPVLLTPQHGSGPVYAARLVATAGTSGTILSDLAMVTAPVNVILAPVREGYDAVDPG
jgi:hypothetical protein